MLPLRQPEGESKRSEKEDLAFEISFFAGIARRDPNYVEALQILGDAYTRTGQWEKGLEVDERLARLCPANPVVFYNLACSYSLLNRLDQCFGALQKAVQLGYRDLRWMEKDADLSNARVDARFEEVRQSLRATQKNDDAAI
jgi:tetratricopeptide (TPR) repeat protein